MGFWIFMMIMDLLIPATMIIFGAIFLKRPPKKINYVYGFRSNMSMKNINTWNFAHNFLGKIWLFLGVFSTPVMLVPMLFLMPIYGQDNMGTIGTVSIILISISTVLMLAPIITTELTLRKRFDKDGNIIEPKD